MSSYIVVPAETEENTRKSLHIRKGYVRICPGNTLLMEEHEGTHKYHRIEGDQETCSGH
jgi:hypothetical protein